MAPFSPFGATTISPSPGRSANKDSKDRTRDSSSISLKRPISSHSTIRAVTPSPPREGRNSVDEAWRELRRPDGPSKSFASPGKALRHLHNSTPSHSPSRVDPRSPLRRNAHHHSQIKSGSYLPERPMALASFGDLKAGRSDWPLSASAVDSPTRYISGWGNDNNETHDDDMTSDDEKENVKQVHAKTKDKLEGNHAYNPPPQYENQRASFSSRKSSLASSLESRAPLRSNPLESTERVGVSVRPNTADRIAKAGSNPRNQRGSHARTHARCTVHPTHPRRYISQGPENVTDGRTSPSPVTESQARERFKPLSLSVNTSSANAYFVGEGRADGVPVVSTLETPVRSTSPEQPLEADKNEGKDKRHDIGRKEATEKTDKVIRNGDSNNEDARTRGKDALQEISNPISPNKTFADRKEEAEEPHIAPTWSRSQNPPPPYQDPNNNGEDHNRERDREGSMDLKTALAVTEEEAKGRRVGRPKGQGCGMKCSVM